MEKINRILRGCCMALAAAMMAGCASYVLLRAMGFGIAPLPVYLSAAGVAALMQFARRNNVLTLIATLAALAGGAVKPSKGETDGNTRARSAKLRVFERREEA